jgi:hypothetical protein
LASIPVFGNNVAVTDILLPKSGSCGFKKIEIAVNTKWHPKALTALLVDGGGNDIAPGYSISAQKMRGLVGRAQGRSYNDDSAAKNKGQQAESHDRMHQMAERNSQRCRQPVEFEVRRNCHCSP